MQDPKNSQARKPWYQRAIEMGSLWRSINSSKAPEVLPTANNATLWKTITKSTTTTTNASNSNNRHNNNNHKLRKCTSLKVATTFTRVCLCAPISSYNEVFRAELPPRRSNSYPRSKPLAAAATAHERTSTSTSTFPSTRLSTDQGPRRVFRGKSLTDDVLMRRFVVAEEAMMQVRRRNQMEVIRRRSIMRRSKLGPSPLSRMVMAHEHQEED